MKASLVIDYHLNNKIFDLDDVSVNRDDYAYSIWLLKEVFKARNVDFSTCDINRISDSNIVICFDVPENIDINLENSYLFLFESEVIKPRGWDLNNHKRFKKVFTWNDEFIDNRKYFKMNYSHKFPENKEVFRKGLSPFHTKKLCTLIAGNKKVKHALELYSEREKAIRWFEKNAIEDFDFYGQGWNKRTSSNRFLHYFFSKFNVVNKFFIPKYPSYKGSVASKKETLSRYKFSICYENAKGIHGYITEKIFDCFFSGCVPIYWGAPNISRHIPESCFIDRRDFGTHEELYAYINSMKESEYLEIQRNIENYLFSEKAAPFRAENFAKMIVDTIIEDLALE